MTDLIIRPYQAGDRADLMRIAADTAYFGEPIEAYMEDRNPFLDSFYSYYPDFEPEHTWIAEAEGKVAGFLTGCSDSRRKDRMLRRYIIPRLLLKTFTGRYRFGRRSFKYLGGMLSAFFRQEFTSVDLDVYPAHLHINVDSAWRGHHLGQRLMQAYLEQLCREGVRGVYLDTTSQNEIACRMYEKMGFKLLDARPDLFWTRWFGHPVDNRCYGMILCQS